MAHTNTHLAEYIRIRVILQKHRSCACVVVACCNVQRREADFSFCAIVDEQSYDILMSLLKGHGQRSESILRHTRQSVRSLVVSWRKNMGEGKLWQRNRMETKRVWFSRGGIQEFWQDLPLEASLSSSVPLLECSDWLHSPEETSQPLDGFLVQPCRVEWNPSVSERRTHTHAHKQSSRKADRITATTTYEDREAHTQMYRERKMDTEI